MKVILLALFVSLAASADELKNLRVKTFFQEQAQTVLDSLPRASAHRASLERALRVGTIEIVERELVDNTGSLVDAIGVPGKVTLSRARWLEFIRENRDVRLLVTHELMRMASIPDDNYVQSRTLVSRSVLSYPTRAYCDLRVAQTLSQEVRKPMKGVGYAPTPFGGTVFMTGRGVDTSAQDQAMDAAIQDIREKCQAQGFESYGHGSGMLSMENRNTNGRRRMEFKVTLDGVCAKQAPVKRPKVEQKREGCRKVAICRELITQEIVAPLESVDAQALEDAARKWTCE